MQTCQATFNNRGAPLTAVLIKVVGKFLSGVHSAKKALPRITIRDVPGSTHNYTPQPHSFTSLSEENYTGWHPPPWWGQLLTPSVEQAGVWARKLVFRFLSALQVLSLPEKEFWLQLERSFIRVVKNNNLYFYRRLVSKRNYASITGHFRPLVICLHFHKNVYFSLWGRRPVSTVHELVTDQSAGL